MAMFQSLLDAHTTYYLPNGYGEFMMVTPFGLRSAVVGGAQKFFTKPGPYPSAIIDQVCDTTTTCPYNSTLLGAEVTHIDGTPILDWLRSFTKNGGTYLDDGVRVNDFVGGFLWGQTSLSIINFPASDTYTVTLIKSGTTSPITITLPYIFAGDSDLTRSIIASENSGSTARKREEEGHFELPVERKLLEKLQKQLAIYKKRDLKGAASARLVSRAEAAILELATNIQMHNINSVRAIAVLKRDGLLAHKELPYIASPRERLIDVARLSIVLYDLMFNRDFEAIEAASDAQFREFVAEEQKKAPVAVANKKKSTAAATEVTVTRGDSTQFKTYYGRTYSATGAPRTVATYNSYRTTTVLKLNSFRYDTGDVTWVGATTRAHTERVSRGLNENLIIDVSGNGGGLVCLNFETLSYLVKGWANWNALSGSDILFSGYDMRISPLFNLLDNEDEFAYADAFYPNNGTSMGRRYITQPVSRTVGSKTSEYTRMFNWRPCYSYKKYFVTAATYHFDKIIVLTDGRCGSSCAYFVTQLRENNKVRVVSYGGIYGEALSTSSFAGGNVYNWEYISKTALNNQVPKSPYSSYIAYNIRENFSNDRYPTPRQFERLEADWYMPMWDSINRYAASNPTSYAGGNATAIFDIYESILPLFSSMPAGLPRTAPAPSPKSAAPSASAFSAILIALSALLCAIFA